VLKNKLPQAPKRLKPAKFAGGFGEGKMQSETFPDAMLEGASCEWPKRPRVGHRDGLCWYLLEARSNAETRLRELLGRFGYELYYPRALRLEPVPKAQLSRAQRNSGTEIKRPRLVPLFPSYPFIRFDIADPRAHELFKLAGVYGLHCTGDRPVMIDDLYVEHLRRLEVNSVVPSSTLLRDVFMCGEQVRVVDGPFASFSGEVQAVRLIHEKLENGTVGDVDESSCVTLALAIFGRVTPVTLPLRSIEKL